MDSNIISGIIGVGGAIIGTILGSFIQWKFYKNIERKDTLKLLVTLKAEIDSVSMDLMTRAVEVRFFNFNINVKTRQFKEYKNGHGKQFPSYNPTEDYDPDELSEQFLKSINQYSSTVKTLKRYISELTFYCPSQSIDDLFRRIKDYDLDKYKYIMEMPLDEFFELYKDVKVHGKETYYLVTKDFEAELLQSLQDEIKKEVDEYR